MRIQNDHFYVSGMYYLKNETKESQTLVYPFPVNPLLGKVDSLYVYNITNGEVIIPIIKIENTPVIKIGFEEEEQIIQISYRQVLLGNQAEYVLKSTRGWKNPLVRANYELIVPVSYHMTYFSLLPNDSIVLKNEKVYFWEIFNFMPTENFLIEYQVK
jgi:hypothetical protein